MKKNMLEVFKVCQWKLIIWKNNFQKCMKSAFMHFADNIGPNQRAHDFMEKEKK